MANLRDVSIIGVGMTDFGVTPQKGIRTLVSEATDKAMKDCKKSPRARIGGVYMGSEYYQGSAGAAGYSIGVMGEHALSVENGCASGSTAFNLGYRAVATGLADAALVVGADNLTSFMKGVIVIPFRDDCYYGKLGMTMPSLFGLLAKRHMKKYGTKVEQFAKIAVKAHKFAALNPVARYKKEVTVEDVLNSKIVADPLTVMQCCPIADGASALILCASEYAFDYHDQPIHIRASLLEHSAYFDPKLDVTDGQMTRRISKHAYEMAGVGPEDLDVLEVHDCFATCELLIYESIGLCPPGEGGRLVDEGVTDMGGRHPVCPSGGLLAKGHPIGATGGAQIIEIVEQLRGKSGPRQIPNVKIGMAHNYGGFSGNMQWYGNIGGMDFGNCSINILERQGRRN